MHVRIFEDECMAVLNRIKDHSVHCIYIDPPFNTGKTQKRKRIKDGKENKDLSALAYSDKFDDYISFLREPLTRSKEVLTDNGSIFVHVDYREVHYVKILMDTIFGRDSFMNEIIWAYDYGGRSKSKWSAKHDTILWYAVNPKDYTFNFDEMDRIPYMAPGLVGKEKAALGKTPTDCYSDDTEVLTNNGWKLFKNLTKEDLVATVTPTKELFFVKPTHYICKKHTEDMVSIKSKTIDLLVTKDHNLYVKRKHGTEYSFMHASDLINKDYPKSLYFSIMNTTIWNGENKDIFEVPKVSYRVASQGKVYDKFLMKYWCELLGWYIAEGCLITQRADKVVCIAQKKEIGAQRIQKLLEKLKIKYNKREHCFYIYNKQLHSYFKNCGELAQNKRIPREYLSLNTAYLQNLYDGLIGGDGNIKKINGQTDSICYFTSSQIMENNIAELIIKLGYLPTTSSMSVDLQNKKIHTINGRKVIANHTKYIIYRRISKESTIFPNKHVSTVAYDGNVYCVTAPPWHTLVVRRNGHVAVCGNCWWHTIVPTNGKEKTGYPTQKPIGILDRIIKVHTNVDDIVLDFFAGSGTTGMSAAINGRVPILVDSNPEAINIMESRFTAHNIKTRIKRKKK